MYQIDKIDKFLEQVYSIEIPPSTIKTLSDLFSRNAQDRDTLREGQTNRNSQIMLRENQNKKPLLPMPQD